MVLLRVFLSSPGDVNEERGLARRLIKDELSYNPLLRGRVTFEVVSWDDPASPIPMPAPLRPQEAVNRFSPKPSECDIVVVVLWSRLGTHLDLATFGEKPGGGLYLSGTEWEYEDALGGWNAKKSPEILIYRRVEDPKVGMSDPAFEEKRRQYLLVKQFFEHFRSPEGSLQGGWTPYKKPTGFKERLATDLLHLLRDRLDKSDAQETVAETVPAWIGSPYPGLRPFTDTEEAIFFGRGREVDDLVTRLRESTQRFLAVVGASGTGKSSLIYAGLIPRLRAGAIEGSERWSVLTFTPGAVSDNPLAALAVELSRMLQPSRMHKPVEIAKILYETPQRLSDYVDEILVDRPTGAALMLFIDQLEELFTLVPPTYQGAFIRLLDQAANNPRLRVLVSLRADFFPQCAVEPTFAVLLQAGTFVLGAPGLAVLPDMIRKPAERAGLDLEDGLVDEILKDAGDNPGEALPLVAFCLDELYRYNPAFPERRLTLDAYHDLGRLRGAIGRQVSVLMDEFQKAEGTEIDVVLPSVFRALVHIDATGKASRQRASRNEFMAAPAPIPQLIEKLISGRLLLAEDAADWPVVTLAHESLIQEWPALGEWLNQNRAQMQRLQRLLLNLTASEPKDRQYAIQELAKIGPEVAEAVPALVAALSDNHRSIRQNVAAALGRIGLMVAKVVPALISALGDVRSVVRASAADALGEIGPAAAEAVPALIVALDDLESEVRTRAADALGRIGPAAAEAVPALVAFLGDVNGWGRQIVADALGQIGPEAADAVPALISALGDVRSAVRASAASALGEIGPAAADAVPALIVALGDVDRGVRQNAASALGRMGPAVAQMVPALTSALGDVRSVVRASAASALGEIGPAAADAVPALIVALGDVEGKVRVNAAHALRQIRSPSL